jgi:hypothetical protein
MSFANYIAAGLVAGSLAGCSTPIGPIGAMTTAQCPPNSHTVSFQTEPDPKGYKCVSDEFGASNGNANTRITP